VLLLLFPVCFGLKEGLRHAFQTRGIIFFLVSSIFKSLARQKGSQGEQKNKKPKLLPFFFFNTDLGRPPLPAPFFGHHGRCVRDGVEPWRQGRERALDLSPLVRQAVRSHDGVEHQLSGQGADVLVCGETTTTTNTNVWRRGGEW
jgi:hypothetical protein